jgi:hypothetical protein
MGTNYGLFAELNFGENFSDFSSRMKPTDLLLYAGIAVVVYVLFQKKLTPVKDMILKLFKQGADKVNNTIKEFNPIVSDGVVQVPKVTDTPNATKITENVFFDLIHSWKQTRDLAVKAGCDEAIEKADEMFPLLSVTNCKDNK